MNEFLGVMGALLPYGFIILAAVAVLDATLLRWLLRYTVTFGASRIRGGTPDSNRLLVYLPGILFDEDSVAEVKSSMLEHFGSGLFISYGYWRFLPREVVRKTAAEIGHSINGNGPKSVVIVGASFGGRVAADLCVELQTQYGWDASALKVVMVDTPCENNSFQRPGLTVSLIMRWIYAGPLLSLLTAPITKRFLEPPHDEDIEPGLPLDIVKKKAVDRMARFKLSSTADQQRYLADDSIQWTMGLSGVAVTYVWCTLNNITVVQPAAMRKVQLFTRGKVSRFDWYTVASPHCGFMQMPTAWQTAFRDVLAVEPIHQNQD